MFPAWSAKMVTKRKRKEGARNIIW